MLGQARAAICLATSRRMAITREPGSRRLGEIAAFDQGRSSDRSAKKPELARVGGRGLLGSIASDRPDCPPSISMKGFGRGRVVRAIAADSMQRTTLEGCRYNILESLSAVAHYNRDSNFHEIFEWALIGADVL